MPGLAPKEDAPESTPSKARVSVSNLKHALKVVSAAIERTATIPVLQCVHLEQLPDGLAFEATNLDIAIRAITPETSGLDHACIMPAEKLLAWTKLLSGDEVKLSITDRRATVQCARSRAVLPVLGVGSWPQLSFKSEGEESITLKQGDLARALRFVNIAVSNDASRYTLNGILIEGDGTRLRMVATDGHRLMVYTIPCEEKIKNLLMPARFIKALLPLLADEDGGIDLAFDQNQIVASVEAAMPIHVASKKLTGQFPSWEQVMPKNKTVITAKAGEMRSALERALLLSNKESGALKLTFTSEITIEGSDALNGEARETVDCVGAPEEPFAIGVNGGYLHDLFKLLSGDVRMAIPDSPQKPLMISADPNDTEKLDYVVMPMRLEK